MQSGQIESQVFFERRDGECNHAGEFVAKSVGVHFYLGRRGELTSLWFLSATLLLFFKGKGFLGANDVLAHRLPCFVGLARTNWSYTGLTRFFRIDRMNLVNPEQSCNPVLTYLDQYRSEVTFGQPGNGLTNNTTAGEKQ